MTVPVYPNARYSGRGIVTCAGGVKYLTCAWVLIRMLRYLGCTLPIELWYLGEDEGDPNWIKLAEPLGVTCVDAFEVAKTDPHPHLGGWESKSYAILHSRFEEVLFLDADNIPVIDPTFLFEGPEYRETGAIFWPDGMRTPPESSRWQIFDVPYRDEKEQESGQILINKRRSWTALRLCNWYNEHSDFFYKHVYGDKDTFRLAWHRASRQYAMPTRGPEPIPFTLCQFDFGGRRLFQHRIHDKWSLFGNKRAADFWYEDLCNSFVDELGKQWSPAALLNRNLTREDLERMALMSRPKYRFVQVGRSGRNMKLAPTGAIAVGASRREAYWYCRNGELVLLDSAGKPTRSFSPETDGSWMGQSPSSNRLVRLVRIRR
ncbi:MAG: hypothetical protein WD468_01060 [Pirellulales bacterium]